MKIGDVPYINSLPLTYGLHDLIDASPADLTSLVLNGALDVALVPAYAIIKHNLMMHPEAGLIGCDGPVESVGLFTRSYIEDLSQIRSIYMDQESLSSVYLAKIILKKFYGISLYDLEFFHHDNRHMADAQLLIGDKALFHDQSKAPLRYWDLGQLWKEHTGHGFMFACWASKRPLSEAEVSVLKRARTNGLQNIDRIVAGLSPAQRDKAQHYLSSSIRYEMSPAIHEGFKLYKSFLAEYHYSSPLPKKVA